MNVPSSKPQSASASETARSAMTHTRPPVGWPPRDNILRVVGLSLGMLLLYGWLGVGCTTAVCRSDQDCKAPTPYCVLAQCHQCKEDQHCPVGQFCNRQDGLCQKPGESGVDKEIAADGAEPSVGPDGTEPTSPETPPEQPVACGNIGAVESCYSGPAGSQGKGPCKAGQRTCQPNGTWSPCQGEITPQAEVCDDQDNNCDGQVDETWPKLGQPCTTGSGSCSAKGTYTCPPDGSGDVVCDARPTSPEPEVCDDQDNNCDGQIDETFPDKGKPCQAGQGACNAKGVFVCQTNGKGLTCNATPKPPTKEICDNIDNDCNGTIDDGIPCQCNDGDSRPCGNQVGACKPGTQSCQGGTWSSTCSGGVKPSTEQCDGQDNDCDGSVDENLRRPCFTGSSGCKATANGYDCVGNCTAGIQSCTAGKWGACAGQITPGKEECNGKDDDCDGQTDEDFPKLGDVCSAGSGACKRTGKLVCNGGGTATSCDARAGVPIPETCNGQDDDCDGQTDENIPGLGVPCTTSQSGSCRDGKTACQNGKSACVPLNQAASELCRDQKDNDCDGQTDEICGPRHTYLITDGNGRKVAGNAFLSPSKMGTGRYTLYGVTSGLCSSVPAFAVAISEKANSVTYDCGVAGLGMTFNVHSTNNSSGQPAYEDKGLSIVIPRKGNNEIYGIVDEEDCYQDANQRCSLEADEGNVTVYERSKGVYEIDAAPCKSNPNQPIFILPHRDGRSTRTTFTISHKSGSSTKCIVRIYDHAGALISNRFAFWLPDASANAHALTNGTGIAASQNFKDQNAAWALKVNPASGGNSLNYEVTFHAWANPSAVLLAPIQITPTPSLPSQFLSVTPAQGKNGVKVYPFDEGQGVPSPAKAASFHVLFVQ